MSELRGIVDVAESRGILDMSESHGILDVAESRGIVDVLESRGIVAVADSRGILDVAKAGVSVVEVHDGHGGAHDPLVGAAAVEVGLGPIDGSGRLVGGCGTGPRVRGEHDTGTRRTRNGSRYLQLKSWSYGRSGLFYRLVG